MPPQHSFHQALLPVLISVALFTLAGCASVTTTSPSPATSITEASAASANRAPQSKQAPQVPDSTTIEQLSPALRAGERVDGPTVVIKQTPRYDNLITRIREGFAMPELKSPLVGQHERWIIRNPQYLNRVLDRGGKYLFHIVEELEARKMPAELALLPIVESAFNPQALSSVKAAGLWQFIPSTGRIYDLEQNWWMDQRRDVIESTRAALDYLQRLYELQGQDWFLALASYNWGEGAVLRARKRNEAQKKPTDYLSLRMPKETRNYVPKLIALRNILRDPEKYGVVLPKIPNEPFFVIVDKEQSIDLALAARFADMTVEEFVELNPSHHRPIINANRTNRIILPADKAERFQEALQEHIARGEPLVSWKPYTLQKNESLTTLARKSWVTITALRQANGLRSNANPLPGTSLLAPIAAQTDSAQIESALAKFKGSRVIEKVHLPAIYHRVTSKDTLARIANRYRVSQAEIRRLNKLSGELQAGQRLLIRAARVQTVVTDENGKRTVIASTTVQQGQK
jgi:membrane-bound lytic murein transglycosylase D